MRRRRAAEAERGGGGGDPGEGASEDGRRFGNVE